MKLLINESPLQVLPSLAMILGLNDALLIQQLHYRLLISRNERDLHKWVYRTYEEWQREEFPFWSVDTIKRTIRRLESKGLIVSTSSYNRMKMDKTKWYRIEYVALQRLMEQNAPIMEAKSNEEEGQIAQCDEGKMPLAITKEIKSIKKDIVGKHPDVVSVIDYLNEKTGKNFKTTSIATTRLVNARFQEGYEMDDFRRVIDTKVDEWLTDAHWQKYLRPSTLFNATNFENYLETYRSENEGLPKINLPQIFELDLSKGES
ncbi:conserved phage C-terminal domain-containing protein [Sporosarcina pasteurii]|uniref:Conserved phage C-terminus (Phg_2220_C) n=1 Tax=Sporosarcina pasteurii TaxID=1474 RepID=A0A380CLG1_SPOPA|nr:conserved phage C-terminal domain-containing protein [Sporosarcina pasteurii]MDS9471942.1 conserved phage C-terminal domain-containing protein [Sporosarcina pasteurii]QBQ06673.1 replication protein [Sporosarcina pasteurii]SUJ21921.1 Conserved phage C-terminus (Phg_2220_C) [Sporosarcina pasteurii]